MANNKAVFLDRDGVINIDKGYVHKINDFIFIKGIFSLLQYLLKKKYILIIITNQSGIARGIFTKKDYLNLTKWMEKEFKNRNIHIADIYYCPHHPEFTGKCTCRKPKAGLIKQAIKKHDINIKQSWIIGNNSTDVLAGNQAGIHYKVLYNQKTLNEILNFEYYKVKNLNEIINIHQKLYE